MTPGTGGRVTPIVGEKETSTPLTKRVCVGPRPAPLAEQAVKAKAALDNTPEACYIAAHPPVVGFDDIPFASIVTPALTTVHVDKHGLGRMAITRLAEMPDEPEATLPPI